MVRGQAAGELLPYPLSVEELDKVVRDSGCSAPKVPAKIGIQEFDNQESLLGPVHSKKHVAGSRAVVQLLASVCCSLVAHARPVGAAADADAPVGGWKVDRRLLLILLKCAVAARASA